MDFPSRQKKLREQLASSGLDALLVSHLPNIRYLCGFTGSAGFLLVSDAGSVFFTDVRYDTQAREQVKGAKVVIARKAVLSALAEWMDARGKRTRGWTIGIEAEHLTVAERKRLADLLPSDCGFENAPALVERSRMVKDNDELGLIRAAVNLGATLFDRALEVLRPGVKEAEVAAEMEYAARRAGAEEMSFPTIIASGARSSLPHGRATEQAIAPGGFVVCDFGVILAGYCSDRTRTVWVGAPSLEAQKSYESVKGSAGGRDCGGTARRCRRGSRRGGPEGIAQGRVGTVLYPFHRARRGSGDPRSAPGCGRADGIAAAGHGHHDRAGSILPRQMGREDRGHGGRQRRRL